MQAGDHLVSARSGYTHHGIYAGNDWVIHYAGFSDGFNKGIITLTSLDEFRNGNDVSVKSYLFRTYDHEQTLERATSRCGEDWYNVLLNNCEHFSTWCVMGLHSSSQVNSLLSIAMSTKFLLSSSANAALQSLPVIRRIAGDRILTTTATSAVLQALTPSVSSVVSSGVGATVGLAASGAASVATVGIVGLASVPLAPVLAIGATGAALGYGVKKAWDWLTD